MDSSENYNASSFSTKEVILFSWSSPIFYVWMSRSAFGSAQKQENYGLLFLKMADLG